MGTNGFCLKYIIHPYPARPELQRRFSRFAGLCSRLKSPCSSVPSYSFESVQSLLSCLVTERHGRQYVLLWSKCCYSSQKGIGYPLDFLLSVFSLDPRFANYCEYRISSLKIQRSWCGRSLRKLPPVALLRSAIFTFQNLCVSPEFLNQWCETQQALLTFCLP